MVALGAIFLNIGHPGLIFDPSNKVSASSAAVTPVETVKDKQYSSTDEVGESRSSTV